MSPFRHQISEVHSSKLQRRAQFCASVGILMLSTVFSIPLLHGQTATSSTIVVSGEELPSSYGAPPAFSRTRFAPLTTAYVLPPGSFLAATIWQGNFARHGSSDHEFTQEIEVGLPHRFGLAAEFAFEEFEGRVQGKTISLEARYALADWNKIPLNPTIFAEYKFGVGRILAAEGGGSEEEMPAPDAAKRKLSRLSRHARTEEGDGENTDGGQPPNLPDAIEGRLLLSQDFHEKFEWAFNGFFEQETSGDRGREWGFAQSAVTPLTRNEWLKAGVEMQYNNFTDKDTRDDPSHSFVIGPTVAWKPNRSTRFDVSPLFGVTEESPRVQVFVVFSLLFGPGGSANESEAPASTRNR